MLLQLTMVPVVVDTSQMYTIAAKQITLLGNFIFNIIFTIKNIPNFIF